MSNKINGSTCKQLGFSQAQKALRILVSLDTTNHLIRSDMAMYLSDCLEALEASISHKDNALDMASNHVEDLQAELASAEDVVSNTYLDDWWRMSVIAARKSKNERVILAIPVDDYEALGEALSTHKAKKVEEERTAIITCDACGSETANSNLIAVNKYVTKLEKQRDSLREALEEIKALLFSISIPFEDDHDGNPLNKALRILNKQAIQELDK